MSTKRTLSPRYRASSTRPISGMSPPRSAITRGSVTVNLPAEVSISIWRDPSLNMSTDPPQTVNETDLSVLLTMRQKTTPARASPAALLGRLWRVLTCRPAPCPDSRRAMPSSADGDRFPYTGHRTSGQSSVCRPPAP